MATKQQKAVQRAVKRERKQRKIHEEKGFLWFLIALILILLYLLLAQHYDWWPYKNASLGTAFYTNVNANTTQPASAGTSSGTTASTSTGSGSTASGSSGTSSGGTSGSGSSSTSSSTTPSIATFSAGVNLGDTMAQTAAQANGLGQNCAVVASASTSSIGQQQVCTYTQGNKIVTVTYLNDHVVSASKSGF